MDYFSDFSSCDSLDSVYIDTPQELSRENSEEYLDVYKDKYYAKPKYKRTSKAIVFDLDETLGSFNDLYILWTAIQAYSHMVAVPHFNDVLDLFPEFLRYGILPILAYLLKKRSSFMRCYLYTNNQCQHPTWISNITRYFDYKLLVDEPFFDRVICAFKINNEIIEPARTTNRKIHSDFIRCTLLPTNTEICFIDNNYYSGMNSERVYYIQPRSYYHHLSTKQIVNRYVETFASRQSSMSNYLMVFFENQGRMLQGSPTFKELETDIYVTQRLMYHIKEFVFLTQIRKSRTKKAKLKTKLGRQTRKMWATI
uniref:Uncharacterized protein n=1 Tax=viral metagenome TaxID=1070528 RepID=A0A6C0D4P2_9ZZZZ